MILERMMKKIIFVIKMLLIVSEDATRTRRNIKLPKLDALMSHQTRKRNKILVINLTCVDVTDDNNRLITKAHLNLPSEHLRLLAANPKKSPSLFSIADRTPEQSVCLQQAGKWKEDPYFEQPMWTINGMDYLAGNVVLADVRINEQLLMVKSFHTNNKVHFARCHEVVLSPDMRSTLVHEEHIDVKLDSFKTIAPFDRQDVEHGFVWMLTTKNMVQPLNTKLRNLLLGKHMLKKAIPNAQGSFYKVRISPLIFFTADTSGNISKQFNMYENWSMRCASLSFKERNSWENNHYIGIFKKKDGANGASVIPTLVQDLQKLEQGMVMYSAADYQDVLVVAPLFRIEANSPCHSELCGLLNLSTKYPCRKCYICLQRRGANRLNPRDYYIRNHIRRTRTYYELAAETPDRSRMIQGATEDNKDYPASKLSFKDGGSDSLLALNAFSPDKDTPTEILHTVLLEIAQYLTNDLIKIVANDEELNIISDALDNYKSSEGFSRKFSRQLRHCRSFPGRDYKVLLQVLPVILVSNFSNSTTHIAKIVSNFAKLGKLCSLLFVQEVRDNFDAYVELVKESPDELVFALHHYDRVCTIEDHKGYTAKPKVHFLTHIAEDIQRLGTALNFETEKGEQFNKHIREHIHHTNKVDVSKQLATKFGKQSVMRHIIDDGSWLDEEKKRVQTGDQETGYTLPSMKENMYACLKKRDAFGIRNNMIHQFRVCEATADDTSKNILRAIEEVVMECRNGLHLINLRLTEVANALN
ncbi:hypothetical protein EDC96DRAFT_521139 [Choanephora cucurbitarum]|nr:hypothetical protein EDC96DRAFT_521139 [Choanephora cucurbitarum]